MRRSAVLAAFLLSLSPACDSPTEQTVPVCEPGVALSTNHQTPPVFSWSPNCRVTTFSLTGAGRFWSLFAADNSLLGPVTYGVVPPGALTLGLADALETGVEYTVVLERTIQPITFDTVATLRFTL